MRHVTALVAVLAALALAACGGSEPAATTAAGEPTTEAPAGETTAQATTGAATDTTETETVATTEKAPSTEGETAGEGATTGGDAGPRPVVVRLDGGEPRGGPPTIEAKRGDRVRIRVVSDAPDEIHVHGYDLEQETGPGSPAIFSFVADLEGIFEIEGHHTAGLVATLVVEP